MELFAHVPLAEMMRLLIQSLFISILLPPRFECARMKDSTFTGGKIRKDTVLTRTRNSVYYITRNIFVSPRATLTVQAGVTLKIATNVKILIKGALISVGTFHEPITFQGNDEKTDTAADDEHFRMSNKVRLVNGINHNIGLLEISNGNRWEKVCDFLNTWDKTKSMVVCRQLGFWEGERVNLNLKLTGNVSSKLFECQGHETEIGQCVSFGDYFLSNCCKYLNCCFLNNYKVIYGSITRFTCSIAACTATSQRLVLSLNYNTF